MTKALTALTAAAAIAAAVSLPTTAEARGGAIAAGVIGGLAAGAIIGGAAAGPHYGYGYGPGPYYAAAPCYWHRERFWDGYGWRMRRVQVCE
jgi:hypothetical protein